MLKMQVIGNLGKDCTVNTVNGKNVINFSVAHTEKYKDSQGNMVEKTTWVECAYWTDRTTVAQYLMKGKQVYAEGQPELRQYQKNDGTPGASLTLKVREVQLLGGRGDSAPSPGFSGAGFECPIYRASGQRSERADRRSPVLIKRENSEAGINTGFFFGQHDSLYCDVQEKTLTIETLRRFTYQVFLNIGCQESDARVAAQSLLLADLRGIDSHGIARLSGYVRLWEAKRVNSKPKIRVIHETASTAVVDGDSGLGLVVAPFAMQVAIDKAQQVGTGWVSVQNSNHFGIAAAHAMKALEHNMIGIAMTNASPLVAPTFSIDKMLGTNPICVAVPAGEEPAFVADLATTTAANGKLEILQRKKTMTPTGWVQDEHGNPSTDPEILKKGGSLLPLGGDREHGSHKGYALGAVVDIFSALLSGANYAPWVPPFPAYVPMPSHQPGKGIGHFFGAMRIDAFRTEEEFKKHMDLWIRGFRKARPMKEEEKVLVPGDPEREMEIERNKSGIPLLPVVVEDLRSLAERFLIKHPFS